MESTQKCPNCNEVVPLEYSVCPFCGFGLLEYELKRFSYRPRLKEVFWRAVDFLRHPISTSAEMAVASETKGANLIILLFSLFFSLRFYFVILKAGFKFSTKFTITISKSSSITIGIGFILFLLAFFVIPLIFWLLYKVFFTFGAWIIAKFANVLGSELNTKQFKTILGYSIIPVMIGEFLGILFVLIAPSGGLGTTENITYDSVAQYVSNMYTSPIFIVYRILMVILWLITVVYLTISMHYTGKMAWLNAVIAIAGPLGLYVFFFYLMGIF